MPNYIRVKQIDQPELTGFFVDSISSQSGLLVNITSGFASKFFREETPKLLGTVIYATGNQTISGVKAFKTGSFDLLTINGQTNEGGDYSARINFVDSNFGSIDVLNDGNFKLRSSVGFVNINTSAAQISAGNSSIYELGQNLYVYKSVGYDNANINWFNKSITFRDSLDGENFSDTIYHFKSGVTGYIPIDSEVVHKTGDQTISGNKTFEDNIIGTFIVKNRTSAPSSPAAGQLFFDTINNNFSGYNGSSWVKLNN
jgi:hypothetical protein